MKTTTKTPCPYCNQKINKKNIKRHIKRYHTSEKLIVINCRMCSKSVNILDAFGECCSRSCSSKQMKGRKQCLTDEARIEFFTILFNGKYTYPNLNYKDSLSTINIQCPDHGEVEVVYANHRRGQGCIKCYQEERKNKDLITEEELIKSFLNIHLEGLYDYSNLGFRRMREKINIGCNKCNVWFTQKADNHLQGQGCPYCSTGGFDITKPGRLYYLRIEIDGLTVYKIGITNNTVKKRFGAEFKHITIVKEHIFKNGSHAYKLEQKILKKFKDDKYIGDNILESGNTEMFTFDVLGLDI